MAAYRLGGPTVDMAAQREAELARLQAALVSGDWAKTQRWQREWKQWIWEHEKEPEHELVLPARGWRGLNGYEGSSPHVA